MNYGSLIPWQPTQGGEERVSCGQRSVAAQRHLVGGGQPSQPKPGALEPRAITTVT